MVKRRGDNTPEPVGGRAAERLRMFEKARGLPEKPATEKKPKRVADRKKKTREGSNAKQNRRED